ncbi:MAG: YggT family protein [Micrococcaceae bacterium]
MLLGISRVIYWLLIIFFVCLVIRAIVDMLKVFKVIKPESALDKVAGPVYKITEPPLAELRKIVPPMKVGDGVGVDVAFTVLAFFCVFLINMMR